MSFVVPAMGESFLSVLYSYRKTKVHCMDSADILPFAIQSGGQGGRSAKVCGMQRTRHEGGD